MRFLEFLGFLISLGHRPESHPSPGNGIEHSVEFHAGVETGVEITNQGGHDVSPRHRCRHAGQNRGVLGVIAVLAPHPALTMALFEVDRQENDIAAVLEMPHVPLQGAHRCAKFRIRERFADPHGILELFAAHGWKTQPVEEDLPQKKVFHQVAACGQSNGGPTFRFGRVLETPRSAAFPKEIESPAVGAHEPAGGVVPAAEESVGHRLPTHLGNGKLAVVGAQIADFGPDRDPGPPQIDADERTLGDLGLDFPMGIPHGQGRPQGTGQMTVFRNQDRFLETLFKGRHQRPVLGGGALEENDLAHAAGGPHFEQVVLPHRMEHRGQHVVRIPAFR